MSDTSVIKQAVSSTLLVELMEFISAVDRGSNYNQIELVRNALGLMKTLPASRDVVFQFFNSIYEKALVDQLGAIESKNSSVLSEDCILTEVHTSLISFLASSTNTWALVISKWTLELLGLLTSKYSLRGRSPANGSLGDSLNQWMTCQATRSLIDINMKCLSTVINSKNESTAIFNVLDNYVVHIPDLDWAVATVGCHYPYIFTKRVFTWGLQDFLASDGSINRPKMNSLGAVLTHLAGCYSIEIQNVMTHLIKWSLDEESDYKDLSLDKGGAVPLLLQLASLSPTLLSAVNQGPLASLKYEDLEKYVKFGERWVKLTGGRQKILELAAHFILSVEDSAQTILSLIIKAFNHENPAIKSVVHEVVELMNKELDILVLRNSQKVPFLQCLLKNINWLLPHLLSDVEEVIHLTTMIISLIGVQHPSVLSKSISYVLLRCRNDEQLVSVVRLSVGYTSSAVLSPAVSICLSVCDNNDSQEYLDPHVFWINLSKLLKWEASGTLVSLPMQEALRENMTAISQRLCLVREANVAHLIADVVKRTLVEVVTLSTSKQITVHQTMSLVQGTISYFYICLTHTDDIEQLKGMRLVTNIITKLCQNSNVARTLVIRELLESALFRSPSVLFGATRESATILSTSNISLLDENHRQGTCSLLAQRHSVLHAGVIESYKRKYDAGTPLSEDKISHNIHLLISALRAACSSDTHQGFVDCVISVALLLVELISPDVMYNGLPWPEEEFCKVTVERDLYIRRVMDQVPLVWSLLSYIAFYRPALCYCSVILRALVASLTSQWSLANQQGLGAGHCVKLIETTSRILHIMTLGQLLPPPLSSISDALPFLKPHQVVDVLKECVWNYMRYNVPSPALFSRDPNGMMWRDPATSRPAKQYTEPFRLAMLSNISSLGALYNILFVHDAVDEE